ncbi:hypothetical protein EYC84_009611 [Monilinia fructicola]|uniref:Uncharacterized protein n=1 Tax=Monilinia fructicola TaxID=38448 RepID=A0A5M9J960_MONFR|nr:hypothetical protein EYC84_009611 [Monilinia fructicola]
MNTKLPQDVSPFASSTFYSNIKTSYRTHSRPCCANDCLVHKLTITINSICMTLVQAALLLFFRKKPPILEMAY